MLGARAGLRLLRWRLLGSLHGDASAAGGRSASSTAAPGGVDELRTADGVPTEQAASRPAAPTVEPNAGMPGDADEPRRAEGPSVTTKVRFWTTGRAVAAGLGAAAVVGLGAAYALGHNPVEYARRSVQDVEQWVEETFAQPSRPELLPPPDDNTLPYTLVLSVDATVLHTEWDRQHGYRHLKRPGLDYFLEYLSKYYEIVLFSNEGGHVMFPVLEKLDQKGLAPYRLFRDSTTYKRGTYIKDLSRLGRPLERVVVVDHDPAHVQLQPDNLVPVSKWTGTPRGPNRAAPDSALLDLIPFLESLARDGVADVRPAIAAVRAEPDFPVGVAKRLRLKYENDLRLQEKLSATGLYQPVPQAAPYMPPAVAQIPTDVLARTVSAPPSLPAALAGAVGGQRPAAADAGLASRAPAKEDRPTVWARVRAHHRQREREEYLATMRLEREMRQIREAGGDAVRPAGSG